MREFVHLHNHTHYSLLDAVTTPKELIAAAKADDQKAIALTDHGVMFGVMEFYKIAKDQGIKPLIGMEAYIANGSRFDKISGKSKDKKHRNYFHLVLLAKDMTGYKNLMKLSTLGHMEGFYYKPRIDRELLEKYHEGLIACSACIAGVVNAHLITENYDAARESAQYYNDLFGEDFYMELQRHNLPEDKIILDKAPKLAGELGIKLVATNDVHYLKKDHAVAHNVLLLIRDVTAANSGQVDIYNLRYRTPEMYFKTQEEMNALFSDFPDSLSNTLEVADKCNVEFDHKIYMPEFPIPPESKAATLEELLVEKTEEGLRDRKMEETPEVRARIDYELGVIKGMGFAGYFLIVQDFIKAANRLGVRVGPGRGSAAGSLVAYLLGITNIDPLPYDLLFERFLNPERVSMPDIDIDFSDDKRELVIEYVKQKYGIESVAQIVTFGKLSTRAVLTDVGRVLGVPLSVVKGITAKIPVVRGKVTPLADAIEQADLKWIKESDDKTIKELIDYSITLEDKIRNTSTHAAGVVIAPGEITEYLPIYLPPKSKSGSDVATQYSMNELEDAGLLKMDFLGLRTLSIIENSLDMIQRNTGEVIDIDKIDFEDKKTYDLLGSGLTLAVFQFESPGMQDYLRKLKPKNLEEITAMNALYRPGPMENIPDFIDRKIGKKPIEYLHPIMKKSLEKTYGVIVYQEQVMQLVRDIAGFSLGQADTLRRAMGKKKKSVMDAQKPFFFEGAAKNGIDQKLADEIFELIYKFADYGFNKSHSLAYSYLAFQTAWLKAHYPAEFLAANMSAELSSQTKIVSLIDEAKKFGIKVLPPDVNRSIATFNAVENTIFFGLAGIKNVGISAVESIIKAREEKPFTSFFDFTSRVDTRLINKRTMEALVCSGAFDSMKCGHRAALYASIDTALEFAKKQQGTSSIGMDDLFGGLEQTAPTEPPLPEMEEWSDKQRLELEKEYLSFYVSGHPLFRYQSIVNSLSTLNLGDLTSPMIGQIVRVCGLITSVTTKLDKRKKVYAIVGIEDFTGKAECMVWNDTFEKSGQFLKPDTPIMCIGKAETDNQIMKLIADEIIPIEEAVSKVAKGYKIKISLDEEDIKDKIEFMNETLCNEPTASGRLMFNVELKKKNYRSIYMASNIKIPVDSETFSRLEELFGEDKVGLLVQ